MKIKRKVEVNLPQLIEWAWDNDVKGENFPTDQNEEAGIYFATNSDFMMNNADYIRYNNTFTVEVEEEITEDMVIPILIERRDFGNELTYSRYEYVRIKDIKDESSTLFYIENDDKSLTLIWRDGKLVE